MSEQKEKIKFSNLVVVLSACLMQGVQFVSNSGYNYARTVAYQEWGITLVQIGVLASATSLTKTIANFFGGVLVEKFGPKKCLVVCGIGFALCPILTVFTAHNFYALLAVRILAGGLGCCTYTGCTLIGFANMPPQHRGLAHGIILTGPNVGIVLSSATIPLIIEKYGWQAGCYLAAAIVIVILTIFAVLCKDTPVAKKAEGEKSTKSIEYTINMVKAMFTTKNWVLGSLSNFLIQGMVMGLGTYFTLYLTQEKGLTLVQAGAITAATSLVGFAVNPLSGIISDAIHSRKWVIIPAILLYGFSIFGFLAFQSNAALLVMIFIKDSAFLLATRPLNVLVSESAPKAYVASSTGFYNALSAFGSSVFAIVYGAVLQKFGTYSSILKLTVAMAILIACVELCLKDSWTGKEL